MTPIGGLKFIPLKVGTAATNATAGYSIDRQGFDWATIRVVQSPASATDSADKWVVLKLQEGDTTSAYSDIAVFTGSTNSSVTSGFVIQPTSNTASPTVQVLGIDCTARKRYLNLVVHPDANNGAHYLEAVLSRPREFPNSTTEQGITNLVVG